MKRFGLVFATAFGVLFAQEADPDMQAMMEAWAKIAKPGEAHQILAAMEGEWTMSTKFRMAPEAPWQESTSEGSAHWILGKRFMAHQVKSPPDELMPEGFEGFGLYGYDNLKNEYTVTWMDTMSTLTVVYRGKAIEDGTGFEVSATYPDIMTGMDKPSKWIYRFENEDQFTFEMYEADSEGKIFQMGVIKYQRKK